MKLTIIGGGGVRVPLLTNGLFRDDTEFRADEISLYDIDPDRRATIARIAAAMAKRSGGRVQVTEPESLREAVDGSSFVIASIRPGGIPGRMLDERIALDHGLPGQETVGPGGFSLAMRTIPALVDYARRVAELAPQAWLINFTNPVGIMAEAMLQEGVAERCIGVCDTPREQFAHIAEALAFRLEEGFFDYVGLNHLGWIRSVLVDGIDRLPELLASDESIRMAYPRPFFSNSLLRRLRLLPTEYLFFYYSTGEAFRQTVGSETTRGGLIQDLDRQLMKAVAEAGSREKDVLNAYDLYLASRNASYMAIETGGRLASETLRQARRQLYQGAAGYERIAFDVIGAIHNNQPRVMPVNIANRGGLADLHDTAAVELPCALDANGAHPLSAGRIPEQVRDLFLQVKEFDTATARAALRGSRHLAVEALTANPIVRRKELAASLLDTYRRAHTPHLDYLV